MVELLRAGGGDIRGKARVSERIPDNKIPEHYGNNKSPKRGEH
jgi:hypothetical protein